MILTDIISVRRCIRAKYFAVLFLKNNAEEVLNVRKLKLR